MRQKKVTGIKRKEGAGSRVQGAGRDFKRFYCSLLPATCSLLILAGCASSPTIQPQINALTISGKYKKAIKLLEANKQAYGPVSQILYYMDLGLVHHYAGNYQESIQAFEQAKVIYDNLFTKSISRQASTWLINDNTAPFRGEDFERVMINVYQALNYVALQNLEEALVEARDVDRQLQLMNQHHTFNEKNIYREDGFARFLMGLLYEAKGDLNSLDDAWISYKKSHEIYKSDFYPHYYLKPPLTLKENMLSLSQMHRSDEFEKFEKEFNRLTFVPFQQKQLNAEVYCLISTGLSPVKLEASIPIILDDGFITKFAFPAYQKRIGPFGPIVFKASDETAEFVIDAELITNIEAIAVKNLENRRARIIAKTASRSFGKHFVQRTAQRKIEKKSELGGDAFKYAGNLYNLASEQADLRSWQTLPGQIYLARLILVPGDYSFWVNDKELKSINVAAGKKYFLLHRLQVE